MSVHPKTNLSAVSSDILKRRTSKRENISLMHTTSLSEGDPARRSRKSNKRIKSKVPLSLKDSTSLANSGSNNANERKRSNKAAVDIHYRGI